MQYVDFPSLPLHITYFGVLVRGRTWKPLPLWVVSEAEAEAEAVAAEFGICKD